MNTKINEDSTIGSMGMIETERLDFYYGQKQALHDISIRIHSELPQRKDVLFSRMEIMMVPNVWKMP